MSRVISNDPLPVKTLKVSPSIDERMIEQYFDRAPTDTQPDPIFMGMAAAVRDARDNAHALAALADAAYADRSQTAAAAALQVRDSATARGTNVATKIDTALSRADETISAIERTTAAPPPPREAAAIALDAEIRGGLQRMDDDGRSAAVNAALKSGNMSVIGAVLRGPAFLSGMSDNQLELLRARYRQQQFPKETERLERMRKAVAATRTAATAFVGLVNDAANSKFANNADAARRKREAALIEENTDGR